MKLAFSFLFLVCSILPTLAQKIDCYCFENKASSEFRMQKGAEKVVEWIIIKDDSVAVVAYMDKNCNQSWSFFEEKFENDRENNALYKVRQVDDSISFTRVINFPIDGRVTQQEYIYKAKLHADSLLVKITPPADLMSHIVDLMGSRERTYIRVVKE